MTTIININDSYGDRVEFSGITITEALDAMRQAIIDSFGEDVELAEGIDYEIVE